MVTVPRWILCRPALGLSGDLHVEGSVLHSSGSGGSWRRDHTARPARTFDFLYELGAPRPHRVFLSPEVNACVFCASSSIVAAVVIAGMFVGNATIAIYNGLSISVSVLVNERQIIVQPHGHRSLSVGATITGWIESSAEDGRLIESFEATLDKGFATYIYNVASAAPMIEWRQSTEARTNPILNHSGFQDGERPELTTSSKNRRPRLKHPDQGEADRS